MPSSGRVLKALVLEAAGLRETYSWRCRGRLGRKQRWHADLDLACAAHTPHRKRPGPLEASAPHGLVLSRAQVVASKALVGLTETNQLEAFTREVGAAPGAHEHRRWAARSRCTALALAARRCYNNGAALAATGTCAAAALVTLVGPAARSSTEALQRPSVQQLALPQVASGVLKPI